MVVEVYEALKDAGVSEEKAIRASEALSKNEALTKADIAALDHHIISLERQILLVQSEQKLMKWMLGSILIAVVMPLLKQLMS